MVWGKWGITIVLLKKKAMFFSVALAFIPFATLNYSYAGDVSLATRTIDAFLRTRGEDAASRREGCPRTRTNAWSSVDYNVLPTSNGGGDMAIFVMLCPGGNYSDEYVLVIEKGKGLVVANNLIEVLRFIDRKMSMDKDKSYFQGGRWRKVRTAAIKRRDASSLSD